jgi:hypothetical protein
MFLPIFPATQLELIFDVVNPLFIHKKTMIFDASQASPFQCSYVVIKGTASLVFLPVLAPFHENQTERGKGQVKGKGEAMEGYGRGLNAAQIALSASSIFLGITIQ